MLDVELAVLVGTVGLGLAHGVEPGHGWPVAASYALDQTNKWLYGFAASFVIGVGHLVSSIAMVLAFFWAKRYFDLAQVNEPMTVFGVQVGGPVSVVAGVLLVALGVREYFHGHSHDHGGSHDHGDSRGHRDHSHDGRSHDHSHDHAPQVEYSRIRRSGGHSREDDRHDGDSHGHSHDHHDHSHSHDHHDHGDDGLLATVKTALPFVGRHAHGSMDEATDRGLWGIAGFAFLLGFAHEEEFEIILLCSGSQYCLELMTVYALTVIFGIVGLTLLLIAGYERYEERAERYAEYLPAFSAAVLILMGLGFVTGLF
ncbi:hypothetical protein DMJ13_00160 [halophilic archaeon]|nr:hypothetical protein DMJ13_00160 [halophilic archaeon]